MAGIASSLADLEAWENELFDRYNELFDRYNGEYEKDRKENDHEEMEA